MKSLLLSLLLLHATTLSIQAKKTVNSPISTNTFRFAAPSFSKLNGDKVAWPGVGNTIKLDLGSDATIADADYDGQNGGNGNYSGSKLVIKRRGTAVKTDIFGVDPTSPFKFELSRIKYNNRSFGTYSNVDGVLTFDFASSEILPTRQVVIDLIRAINYRNDTPAGDAIIDFSFSDPSTTVTAGVTVTSNNIYVTNTVHAANINPADGVSLAEAFAISAAQAGTNIIHLATATGSTINLGSSLSIGKNTTLKSGTNITVSGSFIMTIVAGVTVTLDQIGTKLTINSALVSNGSFVSSPTAILSLRGSNGGTGSITINNGTLDISNNNNLPNAVTLNTATLSIAGSTSTQASINRAVQVNGISVISTDATATLNGIISGSGTLHKRGNGTAILTANNTYSGVLNINGGTVSISSAANMIKGNITLSGGRLQVTETTTLTHPIAITSNSWVIVDEDANATLSGQINGTSTLTKLGTGTLTFAGNNNSSGALNVNGGALSIASANNLPSGALNFANSTFITTGAATLFQAINVSAPTIFNIGENLTLSGSINGNANLNKIGTGILTMSGINNFGSLSFTGTVVVAGQYNLPSGSVAINSGGILSITGSTIVENDIVLVGHPATINTGAIVRLTKGIGLTNTGAGLIKTGNGTLSLSGTNEYNGPTVVDAGTLEIDGNLTSTSTVTVSSGAILRGSGSIFANNSSNTVSIANGGTLSPTGNLIINGHLNLNGGSTFQTLINGNTVGSGYGNASVSGNVTLDNPTLSVSHNYTTNSTHTYTLIEKTTSGAINGLFNGLTHGGSITAAGNSTVLTASYQGGTGNHFTLSTPDNTLPVEFISFSAKAENSAVKLDWKTASEKNNSYFTILRSKEGKDFNPIIKITGKGDSDINNSYIAYDRSPMTGASYYKLTQTDLNGTTTDLDTKFVNFSLNVKQLLSVAPNPAKNHTIVNFPNGTNRIELSDVNGRIIKKIKVQTISTQQKVSLDGLPQGTYLIKCFGNYGLANAKLIKID